MLQWVSSLMLCLGEASDNFLTVLLSAALIFTGSNNGALKPDILTSKRVIHPRKGVIPLA